MTIRISEEVIPLIEWWWDFDFVESSGRRYICWDLQILEDNDELSSVFQWWGEWISKKNILPVWISIMIGKKTKLSSMFFTIWISWIAWLLQNHSIFIPEGNYYRDETRNLQIPNFMLLIFVEHSFDSATTLVVLSNPIWEVSEGSKFNFRKYLRKSTETQWPEIR